MKILYLITKSNFGGAQRYVLDLATEAKNKGFLAMVAAGVEKKNNDLQSFLDSHEIPFIEIPHTARDVSVKKDFLSFFSIYKIIKTKKPDIVHFNSSKMALGLLSARIVRFFNGYPKKIIFTAHGWPFNEPRPYWQQKIIWLISWFSVLLSDKTITIAKFDFDKAKFMPFTSKKIVYIPNGIQKINFHSRKKSREEISGLINNSLDKEYLACTVAELNKNKGIAFLIEAVEMSPLPIKFVIVGDGEDREILQELIREKNLEDKIFLTGKIADAKKYLKAFDLFILPSLKEGLPYVILEAGLASLPVVATSVGGIPEIIQDMKSGILVRRGDPQELSTAITYIYENKDASLNFGHALHDRVEKDFNLSNMAQESFKLYREV